MSKAQQARVQELQSVISARKATLEKLREQMDSNTDAEKAVEIKLAEYATTAAGAHDNTLAEQIRIKATYASGVREYKKQVAQLIHRQSAVQKIQLHLNQATDNEDEFLLNMFKTNLADIQEDMSKLQDQIALTKARCVEQFDKFAALGGHALRLESPNSAFRSKYGEVQSTDSMPKDGAGGEQKENEFLAAATTSGLEQKLKDCFKQALGKQATKWTKDASFVKNFLDTYPDDKVWAKLTNNNFRSVGISKKPAKKLKRVFKENSS